MPTKQKRNLCMTFVQSQPNVFDVGPTLHKCYTNVLCLLGSRHNVVGVTEMSATHNSLVASGR